MHNVLKSNFLFDHNKMIVISSFSLCLLFVSIVNNYNYRLILIYVFLSISHLYTIFCLVMLVILIHDWNFCTFQLISRKHFVLATCHEMRCVISSALTLFHVSSIARESCSRNSVSFTAPHLIGGISAARRLSMSESEMLIPLTPQECLKSRIAFFEFLISIRYSEEKKLKKKHFS